VLVGEEHRSGAVHEPAEPRDRAGFASATDEVRGVAKVSRSDQASPVDSSDAPDCSVVAVVQDAVTAQVLWLGLLGADAPTAIARSGTFSMPDVAQGRPLAVRHLSRSRSGAGIIILVEGTASRSQLDSMWPDPSSAPPPPNEPADLERFFAAIRDEERRLSDSRELRQITEDPGLLVREYAERLATALHEESPARASAEAALLLRHIVMGLGAQGVQVEDVIARLNQTRPATSGPGAEPARPEGMESSREQSP
jgi:hypothetical protein